MDEGEIMVRTCPECGGEMYYDRKGFFVCIKCGLTISKYDQSLKNLKNEEEKEDRKKEYLKWWLSSKK